MLGYIHAGGLNFCDACRICKAAQEGKIKNISVRYDYDGSFDKFHGTVSVETASRMQEVVIMLINDIEKKKTENIYVATIEMQTGEKYIISGNLSWHKARSLYDYKFKDEE